MMTQEDYATLRQLVTENSGEELSILEGYQALLSLIEQLRQDVARARGNNSGLRRNYDILRAAIWAHHDAAKAKYGEGVQDFDRKLWATLDRA